MSQTVRALTALALLLAPALVAQEPEAADADALAQALRSDLRNLLVAQESYYAEHGTYATSVAELSNRGMYDTSEGVSAIIILSSNMGWNGVAVHEQVPGLRCAMYVGAAGPPLANDAEEGEASCIGPGS